MKRTILLSSFALGLLAALQIPAQSFSLASAKTAQGDDNDFDKRWRFGLRFTPQLTWFNSKDKNLTTEGTRFGYGFGLHVENRFSETVGLVWGIGLDNEGGKYRVNYDTANNYAVRYWMNAEGTLQQPENGKSVSGLNKAGNTLYVLNQRSINTRFITIPVILKMSTKEISGFKYSGMFGGEIGVRLGTEAKDTYHEVYTFDAAGLPVKSNIGEQAEINLNDDSPLIPMRLGMNLGLGAEYRFSGNTSLLFSVNYFQSFVNVLKNPSEYLVSSVETSGSVNNYSFVKQGLIMRAIRFNVGILF